MTAPTPALRYSGPAAPPPRRGNPLTTVLVILGAVVLVGALLAGGGRALAAGPDRSQTLTAAADGLTSVRLDVSAAEMLVRFGDVPQATLTTEGRGLFSDSRWALGRDGDALVIENDDHSFWSGWGDETAGAVLTLPRALEGEADLLAELGAGTLDVTGDFRDVSLTQAAGRLEFDGASRTLAARLSAGSADLSTSDTETVRLDISAGKADLVVGGTVQPSQTRVAVSAGSATVALPQGTYALSPGGSVIGDTQVDVRTDPAASATIDLSVSAGSVVVEYAD